MFEKNSSYLILGYKNSGKTEIANYIMDKIVNEDFNYVNLENFSGIIDKNKSCLIDNYSSKDKNLDFELNKGNTLILVAYSPLAIPQHKRYFDYVLIPKIGESHNDYAIKTIHSNYVPLPFKNYKEIDDKLIIGEFLIFKNNPFNKLEHVGLINSRNKNSMWGFIKTSIIGFLPYF